MHPLAADSAPSVLVHLIQTSWTSAFEPVATASDAARFEPLPASEETPEGGWRVATLRTSPPPNSVKLLALLASDVSKGDVALLRIEARATRVTHETAEASIALTVQNNGGAFVRPAEARFAVGAAWRELHLPVRFPRDCAAGSMQFVLGFGYLEQTVEVRHVSIIHYGSDVALSDLPHTRITYAGRGADAPWRAEAEARIREHRCGTLRLRVTTDSGRPVPGARVEARLVRHAYEFGTCIPLSYVTDPSPDAVRYRETFLDLFNAACPENDLKWGRWTSTQPPALGHDATVAGLRWLRDHQIAVRGHVFIWPSWGRMPAFISELRGTPRESEIPRLVREHITEIATATRGLVKEWDVVNEPFNHNDLMTRFGDGIMAEWFHTARSVLPDVPLFLNDWGTHDIDSDPAHVAHFVRTARMLLDQGAPLGGLGLQTHVGGIPCPPESLLKTLDHYVDTLGLPVRITEFDMAADDEELQAEYLHDFFTAVFSHPSTVGLQMWGFWAGEHWWPSAALFHKDWSEKPAARALRTLLKETWHTEAAGVTDRDGGWRLPDAFHGRYQITITHPDGARSSHHLQLSPTRATEAQLVVH